MGWKSTGWQHRLVLHALLVQISTSKDIHTCRNFLFEQHWFSAESSERSLLKYPELANDLRLCPVYNGQASCCQSGLEHEQALHFAYWKQIFKGKIARVKQSKMATLEIKNDPAFNTATEEDRQQFETAILKYEKILDPLAGHARCFSTLLVYAAGMICFACDIHWRNEVHIGEGEKLLRILIPEGNCVELWADCSDFGHQARELKEAVLDSTLAIRSRLPVEYLHMFEDQQQLCDWAHDVIALHPFVRPGELEREATPPVRSVIRRLSNNTALQEYDVMQQGRLSRFDTSFGVHGEENGAMIIKTCQGVLWCLFLDSLIW